MHADRRQRVEARSSRSGPARRRRTTLVALAAPDPGARGAERAARRDPVFRATVEQALKAAQTDCNVLIIGETGTARICWRA